MKDKIDFYKIFDERNICALLFDLIHAIHIPSFRIINLLCCGGNTEVLHFLISIIVLSIGSYLALLIEPY